MDWRRPLSWAVFCLWNASQWQTVKLSNGDDLTRQGNSPMFLMVRSVFLPPGNWWLLDIYLQSHLLQSEAFSHSSMEIGSFNLQNVSSSWNLLLLPHLLSFSMHWNSREIKSIVSVFWKLNIWFRIYFFLKKATIKSAVPAQGHNHNCGSFEHYLSEGGIVTRHLE